LLALDVDGVLTDGGLVYGREGEAQKRFDVRDGMGLRLLRQAGVELAVISARSGPALEARIRDLQIRHFFPASENKAELLENLARELGIGMDCVAFVGDDLLDRPALDAAGLCLSVADAHWSVRNQVHYVTRAGGGRGAVREIADLILFARGELPEHDRGRVTRARFGVVIPARYASTRLPGKPLRNIAGEPMVVHVARHAKQSGAAFVTVATDDERIAQAVSKAGFDAVMTSAEHTSGTDRLAEVVKSKQLGPGEVVVNVQGDEPLLPPESIRSVAEALITHERAGIATLATPINTTEDLFNPNVVKVVRDAGGFAAYFSRAPIPWARDSFGREASPSGPLPAGLSPLRHVGIYAYRVRALLKMAGQAPVAVEKAEALEQLRALWLQIPIHVTIVETAPPHGVDTEEDLERIQRLLSQANPKR
jgi:3-deoxy-manno-octulosonate cytidylyltransferase (CMP-KDO synthetase)